MRSRPYFRSPLINAQHLLESAHAVLSRHINKKEGVLTEEKRALEEILEVTLRMQVMVRFALYALETKEGGGT